MDKEPWLQRYSVVVKAQFELGNCPLSTEHTPCKYKDKAKKHYHCITAGCSYATHRTDNAEDHFISEVNKEALSAAPGNSCIGECSPQSVKAKG